jgi:hypothetical protein
MPTYQTGANVLVAMKEETTIGTAATAAGATRVRFIGSSGAELKRAAILSQEKTSAAITPMGRLGAKSVDSVYETELSVGGALTLLTEGIMRAAYATTVVVGFATMTTVAFNTNTVTAAGGDWVGGQGLRVGDIFTVTGTSLAANNDLRTPITAISSTVITVPAGSFTTLAATATGTLTRLRKVINGTSPSRKSYTLEQYDGDTDLSELFLGNRVTGLKWSIQPNAITKVTPTFMGLDRTILTTGTSPWFSSPTLSAGVPLIAHDMVILQSGVAVAVFTSAEIDMTIAAQHEPVIGAYVSPDIFDNDLAMSGTITGLRSDFANLTAFDAETEYDLQLLFKAPTSAGTPVECVSMYIPRIKLASVTAPVGGGDGAKIETRQIMFGPKTAATGYDGTLVVISQSAV